MEKSNLRRIAFFVTAALTVSLLASCHAQQTATQTASSATSGLSSAESGSPASSSTAAASSAATASYQPSTENQGDEENVIPETSTMSGKTMTHHIEDALVASSKKATVSSKKPVPGPAKPSSERASAGASSGSAPAGGRSAVPSSVPSAAPTSSAPAASSSSSPSSSSSSSSPTLPAQGFLITTPSQTLTATTSLTVSGMSRGLNMPMWYEVYNGSDKTGKLADFGAFDHDANWQFIARHLNAGANTVYVYAELPNGQVASNSIALNLNLSDNPSVRPRPNPAEVWWGGLGQNDQLAKDPDGWTFVKKYSDAYYFHTYYWGDGTDDTMKSVVQQCKPYSTKFAAELGGGTGSDDGWPDWQYNAWGAGENGWITNKYNTNGLVLSEASHDTHDNSANIANANPGITAQQIVQMIGNYWSDYFKLNYGSAPYVKEANTWQPEWWWWNDMAPLRGQSDDGLAFTANDGTKYDLNGYDVVNALMNAGSNISGKTSWSFFADTPYYIMTWNQGKHEGAATVKKLIAMEQYFHQNGSRFTLTCNDDPGVSTADSNKDKWDKVYALNSLKSIRLYQESGGRADTYNFESWYMDSNKFVLPAQVTPETTPYTYTWLAKQAVQYVKGIKDDGTPEQLSITKTVDGDTTTLSLTNNGDVLCLPCLTETETGDSNVTTSWAYNNMDITDAIKTTEGYVYKYALLPGQTATIICKVNKPSGTSGKTVNLEAYWNPQDPTGIVRSRLDWTY